MRKRRQNIEHVIPQLVDIEEDPEIEGLLVILEHCRR